mgnify:CR=1 FL=1
MAYKRFEDGDVVIRPKYISTAPPVVTYSITVVDIDVRNMGKEAGRLLLEYMKNTNFQVQTYITKSDLIIRESTQRIK